MRPAGVVERVRAAQRADRAWYEARPELTLAHAARRLISLTGLLWFHDHPVEHTLRVLSEVVAAQSVGTGPASDADWSARCLRVASTLADRVHAMEKLTPNELEEAQELLVSIPPRVLLSREDLDAHADLTLVNEAWWRAAGTSTPYSAACMIAAVGYFRPDDRWGLALRMGELRTRYEDEPGERPELEQEITDSLARFLIDYEAWMVESS